MGQFLYMRNLVMTNCFVFWLGNSIPLISLFSMSMLMDFFCSCSNCNNLHFSSRYNDQSEFLVGLLMTLQRRVKVLFNSFIDAQVAWIQSTKGLCYATCVTWCGVGYVLYGNH